MPGLGRRVRPIVEFGDIAVNYGCERTPVVTRSCKLSLGTEVCLSDETTGARSLRAGTVAMDTVFADAVDVSAVD